MSDNQRLDPVETQARPAGPVLRAIAADKKFTTTADHQVHAYSTFAWTDGGVAADVTAACGLVARLTLVPGEVRALVTTRDVTCPACRGDVPGTSPAVTPEVEVLVERDPDGGTDVTVFLDGVRVTAWTEETVDPGRGHLRSEWDEHTANVEADEDYSPAFKAAVVSARADAAGSKYIEDDLEDDEDEDDDE